MELGSIPLKNGLLSLKEGIPFTHGRPFLEAWKTVCGHTVTAVTM
jgi:hypothetical protein